MFYKIFLLTFILCFAFATPNVSVSTNNGTVIFPIFFSSPETGFGYGGMVFDYSDSGFSNSRSDLYQMVLMATEKQQSNYIFAIEKYFKQNIWNSTLVFSNDNKIFYGIGKDSRVNDEEVFSQYKESFNSSFLYSLSENFQIGPAFAIARFKMLEVTPNGILDSGDVLGQEGVIVSGIGYKLNYDTRNNNLYATKGKLFTIKHLFYKKELKSDYDFYQFKSDYRQYIPVGVDQVLAYNFNFVFSDGAVPFQLLPAVMTRGIYTGRFIDKNCFEMQVEYRAPFFGKWRYSLFLGYGQVSDKIETLSFGDMQTAYGLGLRYPLDKNGKVFLRFDLGFSQGEKSFYVNIREAF